MKCPHISSQLFCLIKVGEDVILVLILIIGFIVVDLIANDLCVAAIRAKDVIAYCLIDPLLLSKVVLPMVVYETPLLP